MRIAKDFTIYGASRVLISLIGFITVPIYTRFLQVNEFGTIAVIGTITTFATAFMSMGIENAVQRHCFDSEYTLEKPTIISTGFYFLLFSSFIIATGVIIGSLALAQIFTNLRDIQVSFYFFAIFTLPFTILTSYLQSLLRNTFNPWLFSISVFTGALTNLLFTYFFIVVLQKGLQGYFESIFYSSVISFFLTALLLRKSLKYCFNYQLFLKIISFGFPFVLTSLCSWLFSSIDRWLLVSNAGMDQTGLYALGVRLTAPALMITGAFGLAWSPIALNIFNNDSNYKEKISSIFFQLFYFLSIAFSVFFIFLKEFLVIVAPKYIQEVSTITIILSLGIWLSITHQFTALAITFSKKSSYIFYCWLTAPPINLLLNLLLIKYYGSLGAALSNACTYLWISVAYYYIGFRFNQIPLHKKYMAKSAIVVTAAITVFYLSLNAQFWPGVLFKTSATLVLLALVIFQERSIISQYIKSTIKK